jgi:hypothetical protein
MRSGRPPGDIRTTVRPSRSTGRMRRAIQRPDEQVAFTRDLLSGLTRAMRAPVTEAVRKLAHEIATADELLIDLVRNAYLEQNPVDRAGARDGVLEHVPPPPACWSALQPSSRWCGVPRRVRPRDSRGDRRHPRRTGRGQLPGSTAAWHLRADSSRAALRQHGPAAELVATRLLTGCVPFDFDCAEQVAEHDQSFAQHDHPPAQPRGMRLRTFAL